MLISKQPFWNNVTQRLGVGGWCANMVRGSAMIRLYGFQFVFRSSLRVRVSHLRTTS